MRINKVPPLRRYLVNRLQFTAYREGTETLPYKTCILFGAMWASHPTIIKEVISQDDLLYFILLMQVVFQVFS